MKGKLSVQADSTKPTNFRFQISHKNQLICRGNYDACMETLDQLEKLKGRDIKLLHNQAVAKFYKGKCKDYMGLMKKLQELDLNEVRTIY